ncbi:MAG: HRDC domain-containing protein [Magnetococcales bacterium]|nr:HRDC domain-containing protein [Magnetococcales bacterium]
MPEKPRTEGVPPYFIATNQQLAEMAASRPQTLAGLARIEGVGKGKLERYGNEMLGVLGMESGTKPAASESTVPTAPPEASHEPTA